MVFIRIKKIKNWKYAYLVENKWKASKTKQKVKEYLGRVHKLDNILGKEFSKNITNMNFQETITELIKFELLKVGFKEEGNSLKKEGFHVNFDDKTFTNNNKNIVFESNEGFICAHTYDKIMKFKCEDTEEETGLKLAETIIEAGISLPNEVFVMLFEKIHKTCMPVIKDGQKFINNS